MFLKYIQRRTLNAQRLTRKLKIYVFRVQPSAFSVWQIMAFLFAGSISITACKKWDDHNHINNHDLTINLQQALAEDDNLSMFNGFITKTGLDTVLRSSKSYTVWAPTNSALQNLDPAIVNDISRLRDFVKNHISGQAWFTRDAATGTRVPMLTGKYNAFENNKFDESNITSADHFVSNGVLHIIDKPVPVLPNVWEYINSTTGTYQQNAFVVALNYLAFDSTLATVDSINLVTGRPVYRPGTGLVSKNTFTDLAYDVKREDKLYTYFIITDNNFNVEADSLKRYFQTATAAQTDTISKWNTVKDLVVEGLYPANALPAYVLSKNGTRVPIKASAIIATKKLSNGIAYVLNNIDVLTADKFRPFFIQGESPSGFLADKRSNTSYRIKYDTTNKRTYSDIMISGHGVNGYYSYYRIFQCPSMKYKVYALGVNDFQPGAFTENIVIKSITTNNNAPVFTTLNTLPFAVPLSTAAGAYTEKELGEFTCPIYSTLEFQLTATTKDNPLVLDYLRIVPVPFP
jgi:uncharacterized surface protein with fasciclin (FAS1) repeats